MINDILNKKNNQISENKKSKAKKLIIQIVFIIVVMSIILIILSIVLNEQLLNFEDKKENDTDKLVVEIGDNITDNIVQTKTNYNVEINVNKFGKLDEKVNKMLIKNMYIVVSENKNWNETQVINVFKNLYFKNSIIAPGTCGIYEFDINNGLPDNVNYSLKIREENNKNINMQYKIRLNDEYIIDQWTKIESITIPVFKIEPLTRARYILEWKWVDSENDTDIGQDASEAIYNICIDINK